MGFIPDAGCRTGLEVVLEADRGADAEVELHVVAACAVTSRGVGEVGVLERQQAEGDAAMRCGPELEGSEFQSGGESVAVGSVGRGVGEADARFGRVVEAVAQAHVVCHARTDGQRVRRVARRGEVIGDRAAQTKPVGYEITEFGCETEGGSRGGDAVDAGRSGGDAERTADIHFASFLGRSDLERYDCGQCAEEEFFHLFWVLG